MFPPVDKTSSPPSVHVYMLAQHGVPLLETIWLEDLAKDKVYKFAFFASTLKLKGATASPIRPFAMPIK